MTTDQLIYAILGGAGFGVLVASVGRWLLREWHLPQPMCPPPPPPPLLPGPNGDVSGDEPELDDTETLEQAKNLAEESTQAAEKAEKAAEAARQHATAMEKQRILKDRARKITFDKDGKGVVEQKRRSAEGG